MMRQDEYTRQVVSVIETEIRTGCTFARIALESADPRRISRNAANAWKAYKTAKAWLEKQKLNAAEYRNIADKLGRLKAELAKLPPPTA